MKAVMENYKINKRVRLILGLNEENDWKCIDYYKKHEEIPSVFHVFMLKSQFLHHI